MKWLEHQREEGTYVVQRRVVVSRRRRTVVALLGLTAVVGWLYVVFGSSLFRVSQIETGGLVALDRGEVIKEVYAAVDEQGKWPWSWRNLLLIDTSQLELSLTKRLFAESVVVDKSWPNVLRLSIKERQSSLILVANNELSLLDHTGVITKIISNEEEADILKHIQKPSPTNKTDIQILTIHETPEIVLGEQYVDQPTVQRWLGALYDLSKAGFGYRNAVLERPTSTKLILNLFEPYDAYFDLLTPMQPQIQGYYAFLKLKQPETRIYEYVDVRIPGKVFYK